MVSANQPLGDLVAALSRAGWGPLRGAENRCARAILEAIARNSKFEKLDRAGMTRITLNQIADRAGYSDRHVRRWMPVLEDLGLITYHRGGVKDGKPEVGALRVSKKLLVRWIMEARETYNRLLARRQEETAKRLASLRNLRIRGQVFLANVHADMASSLLSHKERRARAALRACPEARSARLNDSQKEIRMVSPLPEYMPAQCIHIGSDPYRCNACRSVGWQRQQAAQQQAKARELSNRQDERLRTMSEQVAPLPVDAMKAETNYPKPFIDYMRVNYPDAHPRSYARLILRDKTARELLK